jgi:hypothetical protein
MLARLSVRIYNHRALEFASGAISQVTNGCAAQDSGQFLMFEGKTCSLFGSDTHLVKHELTDIPMKASTQMAPTINEVGIERLKHMF